MASQKIDAATIADYQRDGAVCIRGAFKDWVDVIADGSYSAPAYHLTSDGLRPLG